MSAHKPSKQKEHFMKGILANLAHFVYFVMSSALAFGGDRECVVVQPKINLVIHCQDKDVIAKDPVSKDAIYLGLKCGRRGRDDCLSAFPSGRLTGGLEITRGGEKLVVARSKAGSQLRIFKGEVLAAKKLSVRPTDSALVTDQGEPASEAVVAAAIW